MSDTHQTWIWKDGGPPGPQIARAGERWTFRLPLLGSGKPPSITWTQVPWPLDCHGAVPDGLTLVVDIPADLHGIQTLRFRRGEQALEDSFQLKILPARAAANASVAGNAPAPVGPPSAVPQQPGIPTPDAVIQRARIPRPDPSPPPAAAAPVPPSPAVARPIGTSALSGDYEIQVYRSDTPIPHLSRPLLPHRSLLVGKFSASKSVFPDIDLRGHFVDARSESSCSRQQAKIYWSNGRILLHNLGRSPIALADGGSLTEGATHDWRPGEDVTLPGELSLRLAVRGR